MLRSIVLLVVGQVLLNTASLFAEDAVLGQKYGAGVHAYFSGDAAKAYDYLTAAIDSGSKDPRVFYYRGFAYLKLGREQDARIDFQRGANLESRDVNKFYNVSKSLERIQGSPRLMLEGYRVDARMAVMQETERARKARYEAILSEESRVVRQPVEEPVAEAPAAEEPVATAEKQPKAEAQPVAKPAAEENESIEESGSIEEDPFSTPAAEAKPAPIAEAPAAEEPVATAEKQPKAEAQPVAKPAEENASIEESGSIKEDPSSAPAAEAKPVPKEAAEESADPFADAPAEAEKPADK